MSSLIALFRLWQWKKDSESKTKERKNMNSLTQFKIRILPLLIAPALVDSEQ